MQVVGDNKIIKPSGRSLYYGAMLNNLQQMADVNSPKRKEYENIVAMATCNMLFVNDLVCFLIVDLGSDLKKDGLFKREVKQIWNWLNSERGKYEKRINRCTGAEDMDMYADQQEKFLEGLRHELQVAFYTVKNECDRLKVPASASMTRLHQCRLISRAALDICQVWEERMHRLLPDRYSSYTIHDLRLESVHGYITKLHNQLFTPFLKKFGENEITDLTMAADNALLKKLVDVNLINEAANYRGEEVG